MKFLKICIGLLVAVAAALIIRYSLSYIPYFTIDAVQITVEDNLPVPAACTERLKKLYGTALFGFSVRDLTKQLESNFLVDSVKIRRLPPSIVRVHIRLRKADAVLVAMDAGGKEDTYFIVTGNEVYPIAKEDRHIFRTATLDVQVNDSYAKLLQRYGLDESFRSVLSLVRFLSSHTTLITAVKYDNNNSNSFGNVVLYLSSFNAQLNIREEVSAERVEEALEILQEEEKRHPTFLKAPVHYDLYRTGLVRR